MNAATKRLLRLDCCAVSDALDKLKLSGVVSGLPQLAGSGHIAGVVNPPDKVKYQYWTSGKRAKTLEQWLAAAKEHPGSWWPHWQEWIEAIDDTRVKARPLGKGIEPAPGSYVQVKS